MSYHKRRRLLNYDYSNRALYFVTICTKNHEYLLWKDGAYSENGDHELSEYGEIIKFEIEKISDKYPSVEIDNYVIMPNHIHLIINNKSNDVNISVIINQTKGKITREIGFSMWQSSFHDHIIRNDEEYEKIWDYIEYNPVKWNEDKYFIKKDFCSAGASPAK